MKQQCFSSLKNQKRQLLKFHKSLCDYFDAFILVTGFITVNAGNNTDIAFKNCASFSTCKTEINDTFIDEANHIYIVMPMYNLI